VAEMQQHAGRPAAVLSWSELHSELENAAIDSGACAGYSPSTVRRIAELQSEIVNRVMRAELAYPGCMKLLEGDAL
jgi:hypothetical protein